MTRPRAETRYAVFPGTTRSTSTGALGLDGHAEGVRERAVGREAAHAGHGRERVLDRVRVDSHEAPAVLCRERSTHLRAQGGGSSPNVDRAYGEDGRVARTEVGSGCENGEREPDGDRAPGGREAAELERAAARGRDRSPGSRPSAGGHSASLRRARAFPYACSSLVASSIGPRNCTSCSSSTPNSSCTRRRASFITARQSEVVALSAFSMKFACRGEIIAPPIR